MPGVAWWITRSTPRSRCSGPSSSFSASLAPYAALRPKQALNEINRTSAYRAGDTLALALDRPDEADEEVFNTILWHAIKGPEAAMPPPKTAFRPHQLQDDWP